MTVYELIQKGVDGGGIYAAGIVFLVALSLLIKIKPYEVNIWTSLVRWLGDNFNYKLNKTMSDKFEAINHKLEENENRVKEIEKNLDRREAVHCRTHILRFSDEIMHEINHSEEMFNQILDDIKYYDTYCRENPDFENNRTVIASQRIQDVYAKCLRDGDFL